MIHKPLTQLCPPGTLQTITSSAPRLCTHSSTLCELEAADSQCGDLSRQSHVLYLRDEHHLPSFAIICPPGFSLGSLDFDRKYVDVYGNCSTTTKKTFSVGASQRVCRPKPVLIFWAKKNRAFTDLRAFKNHPCHAGHKLSPSPTACWDTGDGPHFPVGNVPTF